jgi:hypothetical protein
MALAPSQFYQDNSPHNTYGFRKCCEAIREAVPIEDRARLYTELEPFGGRAWFTGRCPLPDHEDKTPSFYIYPPGGGIATGATGAAMWWTSSSSAETTGSSGRP